MDQNSEQSPSLKLDDIGYFRLTRRSLDSYEKTFSFNPQELPQKATILDIGSGQYQEFARSIQKLRPDITVLSVDPSLALPLYKKDLDNQKIRYDVSSADGSVRPSTFTDRKERRETAVPGTVAAIAPHLPFANASIDRIFDNHGAFMYLDEEPISYHKMYIEEIFRLLKPEGQADIYPLDIYPDTLLPDTEKIEKSILRVKKIMDQLHVSNYSTFIFEEQNKSGSIKRAGLTIKKRA